MGTFLECRSLHHVDIIIGDRSSVARSRSCCIGTVGSLSASSTLLTSSEVVGHLSIQFLNGLPRSASDDGSARIIRPLARASLLLLSFARSATALPSTTSTSTTRRRRASAVIILTGNVTVYASWRRFADITVAGPVRAEAAVPISLDAVEEAPRGTLDTVERVAPSRAGRQEAKMNRLAVCVGTIEFATGDPGVREGAVNHEGNARTAVTAVVHQLGFLDSANALKKFLLDVRYDLRMHAECKTYIDIILGQVIVKILHTDLVPGLSVDGYGEQLISAT